MEGNTRYAHCILCVVLFPFSVALISHTHTQTYIIARHHSLSLLLLLPTPTAIVAAGLLIPCVDVCRHCAGINTLVSLIILPSDLYSASLVYFRSSDICTAVIILVLTTSSHYSLVPDVWQHHCRCDACSCPHVTDRRRVPRRKIRRCTVHLNFLDHAQSRHGERPSPGTCQSSSQTWEPHV